MAKAYRSLLAVYTGTHACVDMACALLIHAYGKDHLSAAQLFAMILLYDFCAFVLQLPFGHFFDRFFPPESTNKNGLFVSASCALLGLLALVRVYFTPPAALLFFFALLIGTANAFFHLGAGIDVLCLAKKEASLPGIFISTGAFGLYLGTQAHLYFAPPLIPLSILLNALAILNFIAYHGAGKEIRSFPPSQKKRVFSLRAKQTVFLLLLIIALRSFLGFAMRGSGKASFFAGLAAAVFTLLGKMLGGIAGDRFGFRRTMLISLLLAAAAAFGLSVSPLFRYPILFFFNLSMPITMVALADLFGEERGLAFGLNTTALFFGLLLFDLFGVSTAAPATALAILLSAGLLFVALTWYEKEVAA